jgi:transcriptional antiterminator RfaH
MDASNHWYAIYTKSRCEKKLVQRLTEKGIEAYVPLRKTIRQWSDRKKIVTEPLINSYVFVNVSGVDYFEALNTYGASHYIWFAGKPATIPAKQIDLLKILTGSGLDVECLQLNIPAGTTVKVSAGPLAGLTGKLVNHGGKNKVVVQIDHLDKVMLLTISPSFLEPIPLN